MSIFQNVHQKKEIEKQNKTEQFIFKPGKLEF